MMFNSKHFAAVDKEVDIRKQIVKIFNKQESDFGSLREYNDYLEEIELIIENLLTGTNVDATKAKIARYKSDNESLIKKNQTRLNRERAYFMDQLEKEKKQNELKRKIRGRSMVFAAFFENFHLETPQLCFFLDASNLDFTDSPPLG